MIRVWFLTVVLTTTVRVTSETPETSWLAARCFLPKRHEAVSRRGGGNIFDFIRISQAFHTIIPMSLAIELERNRPFVFRTRTRRAYYSGGRAPTLILNTYAANTQAWTRCEQIATEQRPEKGAGNNKRSR